MMPETSFSIAQTMDTPPFTPPKQTTQQNHIVHIIKPNTNSTTYASDSDSDSESSPNNLRLSTLAVRSLVFGAFTACFSRRRNRNGTTNKNGTIDKSSHTCESSDADEEEEDSYGEGDDGYYYDEYDHPSVGYTKEEHDEEEVYRKRSFGESDLEDARSSFIGEGFDRDTEEVDDSSSSSNSDKRSHTSLDSDNEIELHHQQTESTNNYGFATSSHTTSSLPTDTTTSTPNTIHYNKHRRTATSSPHTDLSGSYNILITDEFLSEYDRYLTALGFNYFTRKVAMQVIYQTSEVVEQSGTRDIDHNRGNELRIIGSNPKGVWDRTLIASADGEGTRDEGEGIHQHQRFRTTTADGEEVWAEAWWEEGGAVHRSVLLDAGSKYGGGDFESRRFMEEGGDVYCCVSTFRPKTEGLDPISITWRFRREESNDEV